MILTRHPKGWIVILQPENLARMRHGDPVSIPDLELIICYEDISQEKLVEKLKALPDPLTYLARGWQVHPDDFDRVKEL